MLEGKFGPVKQKAIPVRNGLIINMEDEAQTWHIDVVTDNDYRAYFEEVAKNDGHLLVDAIITSKNNHPATMVTSVKTITDLSDGVSILLRAKLVLHKDEVIEDVIEELIAEGLSGEELLKEFKVRKENLAAHSDKTIDEVYESLQKSGEFQLR